jgi:hypothetical protein
MFQNNSFEIRLYNLASTDRASPHNPANRHIRFISSEKRAGMSGKYRRHDDTQKKGTGDRSVSACRMGAETQPTADKEASHERLQSLPPTESGGWADTSGANVHFLPCHWPMFWMRLRSGKA